MSTRRSSVGVGVVGSFLYSVGGYDGHSRKNSNIFDRYFGPDRTVESGCPPYVSDNIRILQDNAYLVLNDMILMRMNGQK